MNYTTIAEMRTDIEAWIKSIDTESNIYPYVPENLQPPCWVLSPGEPFVVDANGDPTAGIPFGSWRATWNLLMVAEPAVNETMTTELDGMIEKLLALGCSEISAPFMWKNETVNLMTASGTLRLTGRNN